VSGDRAAYPLDVWMFPQELEMLPDPPVISDEALMTDKLLAYFHTHHPDMRPGVKTIP
jgi:hypothetical protein